MAQHILNPLPAKVYYDFTLRGLKVVTTYYLYLGTLLGLNLKLDADDNDLDRWIGLIIALPVASVAFYGLLTGPEAVWVGLAMFGGCAAWPHAFIDLRERCRDGRAYMLPAGLCIIAGWIGGTAAWWLLIILWMAWSTQRAFWYRDGLLFWQKALEGSPNKGQSLLGVTVYKRMKFGDVPELEPELLHIIDTVTDIEREVAAANLSKLYIARKDLDKAIAIASRGLERFPYNDSCRHSRALAYMHAGLNNEAIADFNVAMSHKSYKNSHPTRVCRAVCYHNIGQIDMFNSEMVYVIQQTSLEWAAAALPAHMRHLIAPSHT